MQASRDRRHHDVCAQVVVVGNIDAKREAGNLGVVPVDGEGDRRVAEHAEIEGVMGVLPDVVTAHDEVLAKSLLQASMEFILEPGLDHGVAALTGKQWIQDRVAATLTGNDEVFVEWRLQCPRI